MASDISELRRLWIALRWPKDLKQAFDRVDSDILAAKTERKRQGGIWHGDKKREVV